MHRHLVLGLAAVAVTASAAAAQWDLEREFDRRYRKRTLTPSGFVRGHLVDQAGQGLHGLIALSTLDGAVIVQDNAIGIRGGRFDLGRVAPGRYLLQVSALGPSGLAYGRPTPVEITVEADRSTQTVLTAPALTRVR